MCSIGFTKQVLVSLLFYKRNHLSILIIAFQAEIDFRLKMRQTEDEKIKLKLGISVFFWGLKLPELQMCKFCPVDWNRNLFITNLDIFSRRQSFPMSCKFQSYTASSSLLSNHFQQRVYCHLATWLPVQIFSIKSYLLSVPPPSAVFCFFKFTSWSTK